MQRSTSPRVAGHNRRSLGQPTERAWGGCQRGDEGQDRPRLGGRVRTGADGVPPAPPRCHPVGRGSDHRARARRAQSVGPAGNRAHRRRAAEGGQRGQSVRHLPQQGGHGADVRQVVDIGDKDRVCAHRVGCRRTAACATASVSYPAPGWGGSVIATGRPPCRPGLPPGRWPPPPLHALSPKVPKHSHSNCLDTQFVTLLPQTQRPRRCFVKLAGQTPEPRAADGTNVAA